MQGPIGIFDSGVGGLTVVREITSLLPAENVIYFGDTARVPYGTKGKETIIRFGRENVRFLLRFDPKLVVVACNTASAVALPTLQEEFTVPVLGVVEPSAAVAAETTATGRVAILATETTVASGAYLRAIHEHKPEVKVFQKACPLWVPIVEEGWDCSHPLVDLAAQEYLREVKQFDPDVVVLGCTHYPLLTEVVVRQMGPGVQVVDSARATAMHVILELTRMQLLRTSGTGTYRYLVTDNPGRFEHIGRRFLGERIHNVEQVEPEGFLQAGDGKP